MTARDLTIDRMRVPAYSSSATKYTEEFFDRIIKLIDDPLLQRDDRIIRDRNTLRTHFRATFRDIAIPNSLRFRELFKAILRIKRMHLQRSDINEKSRSDKLLVLIVLAKDVANILTQKTLNALSEFLHPIHVLLLHSPTSIRRIRRARLEFFNLLLNPEIPGDIRNQILNGGEAFHRFDFYGLIERQFVQSRHAHQPGHSIDLRGARPAFPRLAVPTDSHVICLFGLNFMHRIQNDHAFGNFGRVLDKFALARGTAPYGKSSRAHFCCSSIICFNSAGIGGRFSRKTFISPPGPRRTMMLNSPNALSLFG